MLLLGEALIPALDEEFVDSSGTTTCGQVQVTPRPRAGGRRDDESVGVRRDALHAGRSLAEGLEIADRLTVLDRQASQTGGLPAPAVLAGQEVGRPGVSRRLLRNLLNLRSALLRNLLNRRGCGGLDAVRPPWRGEVEEGPAERLVRSREGWPVEGAGTPGGAGVSRRLLRNLLNRRPGMLRNLLNRRPGVAGAPRCSTGSEVEVVDVQRPEAASGGGDVRRRRCGSTTTPAAAPRPT